MNQFAVFCILFITLTIAEENSADNSEFELEFQWQYINYTWPSRISYRRALDTEQYIPGNVLAMGMKYYKGRIFLSFPKITRGVPATLGWFSVKNSPKFNPLITPYPDWKTNKGDTCDDLISVTSMEIDRRGRMWVLDGATVRNNTSNCPPKLVLLDLNNNGKKIFSYIFPPYICLWKQGYLNDIVIDPSDGGYAYITDHSFVDPGLIVFSLKRRTSWKLRDSTVYPDKKAGGFLVGNLSVGVLESLNGIALSPPISEDGINRIIYYSPLTSFNLYSIGTEFAKNDELLPEGFWRSDIQEVGLKQAQGDGMVMDSEGNLYYTLLPLGGIGKWKKGTPFNSSQILIQDKDKIIWPEVFTFDDDGNLRFIADSLNKFFDPRYQLSLSDDVKFKIFKLYTGTKSYLG